ncbi:MAG TPA: PQQ-like beta-propeller repeat protein [Verrucomicrobiota bacterium]|nr:PQQ-like beta-propeller repeat protein [Verrucomicrobiota bacterium]HNU52780.1 PQQ-like beta-propeller repeat protein [Verrucomicrobiota bacterium]
MKTLFARRPLIPVLILEIVLLSAPARLGAEDWPQWRGPLRNGVSGEKGLLQQWSKEGPRLLWQARDCGSGYSTPAVAGQHLYLLGNEGLEDEAVLALATADGKRLWRTRLGNVGQPNQEPKFPAARSTPTVEGARLYALGSDGDLACLDTATGQIQWRKQLRTELAGKPGTWAYAESPLVDGDHLICTPGGSEATVVALRKTTGEIAWKCPLPGNIEAAYSSPILAAVGGTRQIVQMLQKGLVGIDAATGKLLWRYDKTVSKFNANIPSPVFHKGFLFTAGAGTGGAILRLTAAAAEEIAFSPKFPTAIGGSVPLDDHLYGTTGQALVCTELATGTLRWEERALGAASLCLADGRLYLHGENGEVALAEATPEGYREHGRFTPPDAPKRKSPMEKAWAYPVVAHGRLYLRDHAMLWCYDLKTP